MKELERRLRTESLVNEFAERVEQKLKKDFTTESLVKSLARKLSQPSEESPVHDLVKGLAIRIKNDDENFTKSLQKKLIPRLVMKFEVITDQESIHASKEMIRGRCLS